jgi:hypothetical protein
MAFIPPAPTTAVRSITLKAGETFVVPTGATILSLVCDGATASSTCELPACQAYKCGYMRMVVDVDANSGHSMDETQTYIKSIKVGDTVYDVNQKVIQAGDNPGTLITAAQINSASLADPAIFTVTNVTRTVADKRQDIWIYVRFPEDLRSSIEMTVTNFGNEQYHRIVEEVTCGTYTNPLPA